MAKKKRRTGRKPRPSAKAKTPAVEAVALESEATAEAEPSEEPGDSGERVAEEGTTRQDDEGSSDGPDVEAVAPAEPDAGDGEETLQDTAETDESAQEAEEVPSADTEETAADEPSDSDPEESNVAEPDVAEKDAAEDAEQDEEHGADGSAEKIGAGLVGEGVEVDESEVEDTEHFLKGLVEAILFSSDKPQSAREVARAARLDKGRVQELVEQLIIETKDRGVRLVEVSEGYAFRTNPAYSAYVREFLAQRPVRLSRAQLETLAIVAYRQPITRPEIDDIRGVDSGAVIKLLLERELVRILGKKDEPGRPMIYGTAPGFLDLFSLNSLRDLPTLREFTELSEDSRAKFELEIGEPAPEGPIDLSEEEKEEESSGSDESGEGASPSAEGEEPPSEAGEENGPDESGDEESGDEESGDEESGDDESGDDESGDEESGDEESGDDESGDEESGDEESGDEGSDEDVAEKLDDEDNVPVNAADEEEFPDDDDDDDEDDDDDDDDD